MDIQWLSAILPSCVSFDFFPELMFAVYFLISLFQLISVLKFQIDQSLYPDTGGTGGTQSAVSAQMSCLFLLFWLGVFIRTQPVFSLSLVAMPWGCFCGMSSCFFTCKAALKHSWPCPPTSTHTHTYISLHPEIPSIVVSSRTFEYFLCTVPRFLLEMRVSLSFVMTSMVVANPIDFSEV